MSEPTTDQPQTAAAYQRKFARERLMSLRDRVAGSTIYGVPIEQLDRDELLGAVASLMNEVELDQDGPCLVLRVINDGRPKSWS